MELFVGKEVIHSLRNIYKSEFARYKRTDKRPEFFQFKCKIIEINPIRKGVKVELPNGIQKWISRDSIKEIE